jgi:opacity protein-like surface antigen
MHSIGNGPVLCWKDIMKAFALTAALAVAALLGAASAASADPWKGGRGHGPWHGWQDRHDGFPGHGHGYGREHRFGHYGFPGRAYGYYGERPHRRVWRFGHYPAYGFYRY